MFLFFAIYIFVENKLKGYDYDYVQNFLQQVSFYLFVLILINLAIHYIKKIKNKDIQQEVLNIPENLEISFEGSLCHIISLIISLALSFLIFSITYALFLFNEYFVIQALGLFFVTLPIFYRLSYNYIAYRKLYIKKSKPIFMPIISSLIAFFGLGIMIFDIITMFIPYSIIVSIECTVYLFIIFVLAIPVYEYFLLIQKLEIRQEDIDGRDSNSYPIIKN